MHVPECKLIASYNGKSRLICQLDICTLSILYAVAHPSLHTLNSIVELVQITVVQFVNRVATFTDSNNNIVSAVTHFSSTKHWKKYLFDLTDTLKTEMKQLNGRMSNEWALQYPFP